MRLENEVFEGIVPALGLDKNILSGPEKLEEVLRFDDSIYEAVVLKGRDVQIIALRVHGRARHQCIFALSG